MAGKFTRTVENFTCGHCGALVLGNGYTNHCPTCLWSRHVDIQPGDRAATCGALMEPIKITKKRGQITILHHCTACPHQRPNLSSPNDNFDAILDLIRRFG